MTMHRITFYKQHQIILLKFSHDHTKEKSWICAYVYLPKTTDDLRFESLTNETFRKENIVGVDAAHYGQENLTLWEKEKSAIAQIKELIDDYERRLTLHDKKPFFVRMTKEGEATESHVKWEYTEEAFTHYFGFDINNDLYCTVLATSSLDAISKVNSFRKKLLEEKQWGNKR